MMQKKANIAEDMMYNTFNMGIGMALIVSPEDAEKTLSVLKENNEQAQVIGHIAKGSHTVVFEEQV